MRFHAIVAGLLLAGGVVGSAAAFECPRHFAEAEAAIEKATNAAERMPAGEQKKLVHTLIDDAKMYLTSGRHNHEKPQGKYDHARAIAKADAARGYAQAAEILANN
ncbi:MAG: hypothetical protein GWN84_06605 [Gammaproteobacteria bacterium]|nr:hypothetical protein [Gammaproteobacteria bacterium]NIR82581.1 hypothetical protein [Gammaproteobacteria bacterium]NIR88784.1 hypothetical protein [Gammaproteobacteria bacterium]NIV73989.1 hypothetical protein [Gammaproteobacteria bacterium]